MSSGRSRSYIKRTNTTDNSLDDLQKSDRNSASAQHSPLALGKSLISMDRWYMNSLVGGELAQLRVTMFD